MIALILYFMMGILIVLPINFIIFSNRCDLNYKKIKDNPISFLLYFIYSVFGDGYELRLLDLGLNLFCIIIWPFYIIALSLFSLPMLIERIFNTPTINNKISLIKKYIELEIDKVRK